MKDILYLGVLLIAMVGIALGIGSAFTDIVDEVNKDVEKSQASYNLCLERGGIPIGSPDNLKDCKFVD